MTHPQKLIRLTTVDYSLNSLTKGQLNYLNSYFEVIGVGSDTGKLSEITAREGVRTINIEMKREISLASDCKSLWQLIKLFRQEKPDIVHANTPKASLLAMIAAFITRVPHRIYMVTGLRFETTKGVFRFILKTMERLTCLFATKVIPEGDGVMQTLYREKITRKPMQKIFNGNINGIDTAFFSPDAIAPVKKDASLFNFIFIGRIVKDKGINELVDAFIKLNALYPNTRLTLLGSVEQALDPIKKSALHTIEKHPAIFFVGYQNDVRPFLAEADALVFPSYREGFPNVVLQAGAMGLPSIVTNINGCNEIIIEGVNGMIIPKQDAEALYKAMLYFVENRTDSVKNMAANARNMITSRYEQKEVWRETLAMYKNL